MFPDHESGSFTLACVVFTQSSTWRSPGKSEPNCSHTWPALRAWQLKEPDRSRLSTALSKYKAAGLSGLEVAAASVVCCPKCTGGELAVLAGHPAGHILPSLLALCTLGTLGFAPLRAEV